MNEIKVNQTTRIIKVQQIGRQGFSAYQIALQNGFVGTEAEWLASLISDLSEEALAFKVNISDIVNNLSSTAEDKPLSANQGRILKSLIDALNALLVSDDTTLDRLQEIVDYIKLNRDDLDNLSIPAIAGLQAALDAKADISYVDAQITGSATLDATSILKGKIQLAGDLSGTAGAPLVKSRSVSKTVATLASGLAADYICDGVDDQVEINAAIQSLTNGIVELLPGTYNLSATVVNDKSGVLVRGAVVGHFAKVTYWKASTTFTTMATIANTSAGGFQDIYMDGDNLVTNGLIIGTASTTTKIKNPTVRRLRIEKFTGKAIGGTGTPASGSWDDSVFENIRIATCGTGVDNHSTHTSFLGGAIGGCTIGVTAPVSSAGKFVGTVFTSNTADIDVQSDNLVNAYSFMGCYFESATNSILKRSVAPAGSDTLGGFTFTDCSLRNQSGVTPFINLTNMGCTVALINCTYDAAGGSSRTILTSTNSKLLVYGIGSSVDPIITGTGQKSLYTPYSVGINNGTPANRLTINTPTTADTSAELMVASRATGSTVVAVQAIAGQIGRLQEWQATNGSAFSFVASNGGFFMPLGSNTVPALGFSADTDTGFYRAAADTIGVTLGGTASMAVSPTSLDVKTRPIINVTNPTNAQDAATKNYIDTKLITKISRSVISATSSVTGGNDPGTDYVYLLGVGSAYTQPTAVGNSNKYTIKNIDTINKTVLGTSGQTFDGGSLVLAPDESVDIISDNVNWRII